MTETESGLRPAPAGLDRLRDLGAALLNRPGRDDRMLHPDEVGEDWTGTEPPSAIEARVTQLEVTRTFCFVDLCGFTKFTDANGPHAALNALRAFRGLVRDVAARRGVRVAKWLGDGAFLVAVHPAALVAAAVDIVARARGGRLEVRAAVATGPALLFDGDDYIGRAVNLAARLCDVASASEVLVDAPSRVELPDWIAVVPHKTVVVRGIGRFNSIARVQPADGVDNVPVPLPPEE